MPDIDVDLGSVLADGEDEDGDESEDGLDGDDADPHVEPEPGSPSLENAAFVVLGVAATVGVILHMVGLL